MSGINTTFVASKIRFIVCFCCLAITLQACSQIHLSNPLPDFKATEQALTEAAKTQEQLMVTAQALATRAAGGSSEATLTETQSPLPSPTDSLVPSATAAPAATYTQADPSPIAPADIPILSGGIENYFSTTNFVSYSTKLDLKSVAAFYESQMVALGWVKNISTSYQTKDTATLAYEKPDRIAKVSIQANPVSGLTSVIISITLR